MHPKNINIARYLYDLPEERIALYPLAKRDESKLLHYRKGVMQERQFKSLPVLLPPESLLIYNNTKVIRARLFFYKKTGAKIEIFCLEPHLPSDHALAFQQKEKVVWRCLVGGARKWKDETLQMILPGGSVLSANLLGRYSGDFLIAFSWDNALLTFSEILEQSGKIPIPPYLGRKSEASDLSNYQTIYAKHKGSVAAPTAGLHFTDEVIAHLYARGIASGQVTLHVGAGTFQPVKTEQMEAHNMHTESIAVGLETIRQVKANLGHIIAVGTTSVRTLESLFWIGNQLLQGQIKSPLGAHLGQWTPYDDGPNADVEDALDALIIWLEMNAIEELHAATQIIIAPGYTFKIIEGMLTNFHQPGSTLLLLVAALVGEDWRKIYDYAIAHNFRFLSYGDSSLLMT